MKLRHMETFPSNPCSPWVPLLRVFALTFLLWCVREMSRESGSCFREIQHVKRGGHCVFIEGNFPLYIYMRRRRRTRVGLSLHFVHDNHFLLATSDTSSALCHMCCVPLLIVKAERGPLSKIRLPLGCRALWLAQGCWRKLESCDLLGCVTVGRKMGCREWQPAAGGWSGDFRHGAEGQSPRPGPTRGKHYGQMDEPGEDGWRPCAAGCCLCPRLHQ